MATETIDPKVWGIDLGGTKVEGAILDPGDLTKPNHRLRLPTGAAHGYEHVVSQIARVVEALEKESGMSRPAVLGIGIPGAVDATSGTIKNSNTTCLNGRALRDDAEAALGVRVRMANDANCFALAEATLGAARGEPVVFGIILGTGVGGGVVVHGRVLEGLHGIAGEWGHNPLAGELTPCYCGRIGCVETAISGTGLQRYYLENTGIAARLPEIATRAASGEPAAITTLERLRHRFAEAVAVPINILDPHAIVIGGGVGNLDLLYTDETRRAILAHTLNHELRTKILRPTLGDSAGVFGAAMLVLQDS